MSRQVPLGSTTRRMMRLSIEIIFVLAALGESANAQVVRGRVSQQDGTPIGDASISVGDSAERGSGRTFRSGANGRFRLKLDVGGRFVLRVRRLGYRPFISPTLSVRNEDTLSYDVHLEPVPEQLASVTVNAEIEAIRDLQMLGFGIRSVPATIIGPSQIEAAGRDAHTYIDVLRKIRLPSTNIDETCVRYWKGPCLRVFLNDRLLADDDEMLKQTQFVIDPNELDHILYVRLEETAPTELLGALFIYTRAYSERQRRQLQKHLPQFLE